VLLPLIQKESKIVHEIGGKLFVCGFSQGCGMSIHCLYNNPELVDAAIGLSG
jgi:predicted esterase